MPTIRRTLSASEEVEYRDMQMRLRAGGADLGGSSSEVAAPEWIRVTRGPIGCIRAWQGTTLFIFDVRILAMAPNTIIHGFELSSPEWDFSAYILDDPSEASSPQDLYKLFDRSTFHRSEVLCHRVDAKGKLHRGDVIEGVLLAQTFDSVPTRYASGGRLPLCLWIANQFDHVQKFSFELPVERVEEPIRPRPSRTGGLFELKKGMGDRLSSA